MLENKAGGGIFFVMSTLMEIQLAAEKLPKSEQEALLKHLSHRLLHPLQQDFTSFHLSELSGTIRLREDPLVWQTQTRDDWQ